MKILNYVSVFLLWSSVGIGLKASPIVENSNIPAFQTAKSYTGDATAKVVESYEIPNMPRIRSQDSFPICYGMSSACLAQKYICKIKDIKNCAEPGVKFEISPFSAAAWANTNTENDAPGFRSSHTNIPLDTWSKQSATLALMNSSKIFEFKPESCYPFDQVANKYGGNKDLVDRLISKYARIYKENNTEGCDECLTKFTNDLNDELNLGISKEGVKAAFKEKTYAEFIYKLVFRDDCEGIRFSPKPTAKMFPLIGGEKVTTADVLLKAKEVLAAGNPLQINGFCIQRNKESNKCEAQHHMVISGYKEICKTASNCKKVFKVQNSWGEDWQKKMDNGWIDADALLANVTPDITRPGFPISPGSISWLE